MSMTPPIWVTSREHPQDRRAGQPGAGPKLRPEDAAGECEPVERADEQQAEHDDDAAKHLSQAPAVAEQGMSEGAERHALRREDR